MQSVSWNNPFVHSLSWQMVLLFLLAPALPTCASIDDDTWERTEFEYELPCHNLSSELWVTGEDGCRRAEGDEARRLSWNLNRERLVEERERTRAVRELLADFEKLPHEDHRSIRDEIYAVAATNVLQKIVKRDGAGNKISTAIERAIMRGDGILDPARRRYVIDELALLERGYSEIISKCDDLIEIEE